MEWTKKYNSFNSWKGLAYYQNYREILDWMNGSKYLPPPVGCSFDPISECNISCYFCIGQEYLRNHRNEKAMRKLPTEYLYTLVDFLAEWGVKSICIAGGGEPSLHEGIWELPSYAVGKGLDVSFMTNATNINPRLADSLMDCRWVAMSVDSGDRGTYLKIKGKDLFNTVIKNIENIIKLRELTHSDVDLCFKFLLLPENQYSIYDTCKLAKSLGVQDFHVRPVDFEYKYIKGSRKLDFDIPSILEQFERCHKEETENFHAYTVTHKFDKEFHVMHNFSNCMATPIDIPILTDGNAYLCIDHKMNPEYRLGSCYPDPKTILEWWGSDKHRAMIKTIAVKNCSRCTRSSYNEQIENVILKDDMCLNFP